MAQFDCRDPRCHLIETHDGGCVYDLDTPTDDAVAHQVVVTTCDFGPIANMIAAQWGDQLNVTSTELAAQLTRASAAAAGLFVESLPGRDTNPQGVA